MRVSIRTKLISIILFFVLVPIIFLGSHIYQVATQSLQERIGQTMRIQAVSLIDQIDRMLFERYRNVQNWSEEDMMLDILNDDPETRISNFLTTLKKQYGFYADIVCTDNSGKVIAASNPELIGKSAREELWFKKALSGEMRAGVETGAQIFQGYSVVFAAPVYTQTILTQVKSAADAGSKRGNMVEALEAWKPNTLGTIAAWLNWSELVDFVNSVSIQEGQKQSRNAYAMLINRDGLALSQPFFEEKPVMFRDNFVKSGMRAAQKASQGESGYSIETGHFGTPDFIGYAPSSGYRDFKGFGWSVLVFQNAAEVLSPIRAIKFHTAAVSLLVVVAAGIVALFFATGISRPIEKLAEFTRAVGRGDFSYSAAVRSQDEVGTLAASFNEMISNIKKVKTELTTARDFTDNVIKSLADSLVVLDINGRIKSANPAVRSILGYEEKEIQGLSADFLFTEEHRNDKSFIEMIVKGEGNNLEVEYRAKDGSPVPVLFSSAALKDTFGKFQGTVMIARDMRQYKSLQSKFLEAQKMDAIGRLAGGVAHDFNNMLTVINGYSEDILRGKGSPDAIPRKVGEVLKAGRRATRLVAQLLSFSRRQNSKPTIIDINQSIQGLDKMLRLITGASIELVALPVQNIWPVKVDAGQFEQVVTNLSVNARDAMPNGGKLVLQTFNVQLEAVQTNLHEGMKPGDYVLLEVKDSGTGMTEEVKKRIFEPFFTTKPKGKGTGLGLATCFDFVKESGGFIEVETAVGKGTSFKLYFPKAEGKAQNAVDAEVPEDLPRGSETVLLVEDEDLVRQFTQRILSDYGYKVITAMSSERAIKASEEYQDSKIDLLLTDVVMPGMDGRELAAVLREKIPGLKVILMSGYVEDESFEEKIAGKGFAFLQKPITAGILTIKIREVLGVKIP